MSQSPSRGFTLIELMVVVAIVGLLSSVALPVYLKATLRTRAAERGTVQQSISIAVQDAFNRSVVLNAPGGELTGDYNPVGAPGTAKRRFDLGSVGWRDLSLVLQGECYYSYYFDAKEGATPGYTMDAMGDLDGDTKLTHKTFTYVRTDGAWDLKDEQPPAGKEDDVFYSSF